LAPRKKKIGLRAPRRSRGLADPTPEDKEGPPSGGPSIVGTADNTRRPEIAFLTPQEARTSHEASFQVRSAATRGE
jgi:hypothetical protein